MGNSQTAEPTTAARPFVQDLPDNYFDKGDRVKPRRIVGPDMVVSEKRYSEDAPAPAVSNRYQGNRSRSNRAIEQVETWWFNTNGDYCKASFNPMDLIIVERAIPAEQRRNR